jgi:hypothetical protein
LDRKKLLVSGILLAICATASYMLLQNNGKIMASQKDDSECSDF